MSLKITILGCGSSGGVPRVGGDWGLCDSAEPKNRRKRCSLLLEQSGEGGVSRVVIDTSPDMREQMLGAGVTAIDGVWYTHEHADHTHGIDELRGFYLRQRKRIPIWADRVTTAMLEARFGYCFVAAPGSDYPPILEPWALEPFVKVTTPGAGGPLSAMPFTVRHGSIDALGFRVGDVAYTPDLNGISDRSLPFLADLDLWIVDALKRTPHPSHFCLQETLAWISRFKPRRAILTNMHVDMDYRTLKAELPSGIEPAYDGMSLVI